MTDQLKQAKRIRRLNDKLRRELPHGSVVISREIGRQFSNDKLRAITELIQRHDAFSPDCDPGEWHDTGVIEFEGVQLVWRVRMLKTEHDTADQRDACRIIRISLGQDDWRY